MESKQPSSEKDQNIKTAKYERSKSLDNLKDCGPDSDDNDMDSEMDETDMAILRECAETVVELTRRVERETENEMRMALNDKVHAKEKVEDLKALAEFSKKDSGTSSVPSEFSKTVLDKRNTGFEAQNTDSEDSTGQEAVRILAMWNKSTETDSATSAEVLFDIIKEKMSGAKDEDEKTRSATTGETFDTSSATEGKTGDSEIKEKLADGSDKDKKAEKCGHELEMFKDTVKEILAETKKSAICNKVSDNLNMTIKNLKDSRAENNESGDSKVESLAEISKENVSEADLIIKGKGILSQKDTNYEALIKEVQAECDLDESADKSEECKEKKIENKKSDDLTNNTSDSSVKIQDVKNKQGNYDTNPATPVCATQKQKEESETKGPPAGREELSERADQNSDHQGSSKNITEKPTTVVQKADKASDQRKEKTKSSELIVIDLEATDEIDSIIPSHKTPVKQIAGKTNVNVTPGSASKSRDATPRRASKKSTTPGGKGNFIDNLIAKGVPIIIPDEDEDIQEMPKARSLAFTQKSPHYNKDIARGSPHMSKFLQQPFSHQTGYPVDHAMTSPHHQVIHSPVHNAQPRKLFTPPKNIDHTYGNQTVSPSRQPATPKSSQHARLTTSQSSPVVEPPLNKLYTPTKSSLAQPTLKTHLSPAQQHVPPANFQSQQALLKRYLKQRQHQVPQLARQQVKKQNFKLNPSGTIVIDDEPSPKKASQASQTQTLHAVGSQTVNVPEQPASAPLVLPVVTPSPVAPSLPQTQSETLPVIANVTSMAKDYGQVGETAANNQHIVQQQQMTQQAEQPVPHLQQQPSTSLGSLLILAYPGVAAQTTGIPGGQLTLPLQIAQVQEPASLKRRHSEDTGPSQSVSEPEVKRRNTSENSPSSLATDAERQMPVLAQHTRSKSVTDVVIKTEQLSPTKQAPGIEIDIDIPGVPSQDFNTVMTKTENTDDFMPFNFKSAPHKLIKSDRDLPIPAPTQDVHPEASSKSHARSLEASSTSQEPDVASQEKPTIDKKFGCGDCGKTFTTKHGLTIHFKTHTKEVPFECDVCGRHYSKKGSLMKHIHTHFTDHS